MNESQLIEQKKNRSLETIITSHDNNFNLVRLIAAIFVVIYHSYELNTRSPFMTDPLTSILSPYSNTGDVGVGTFFIISGIFVTQSWLRDANLVRFSAKRFARIVPGLFVCLLLTTVTAVIFCSEKGWRGLFTQAPWQYIFENTLIHRLKDIIPPVENQVPGIYYNLNNTFMNGSLWTLYWEVRMYVLLALIGVSSIIPARQWFASVAIFCLIAAAVHPELITPYMWEFKLFTLFMAGVLIQCCAAKIYIQVRHVVCAFAYLFLMYKAPTFFGVALCFGALSLWVGSTNNKLSPYLKRRDYSYGIYIYHWPVIQILRSFFPPIGPIELFFLAMSVTVPLAMLSWHYVELPAMGYARTLVGRIQRASRKRSQAVSAIGHVAEHPVWLFRKARFDVLGWLSEKARTQPPG